MFEPNEIKRSAKYGFNYWESFSPRLKRIVNFFTDLEYENWILIETNPEVVRFCERPKIINSTNKLEDVSPFDMWIEWKNSKQTMINIFYSSDFDINNKQYEKNMEFINGKKNWCLNNNFDYEVIIDKDIREPFIYLNNKKKILSNLRVNPNRIKSDTEKILDLINTEMLSIKSIHERLINIPLQRIINGICWLIFYGYIDGNFKKSILDLHSEVWLYGKT